MADKDFRIDLILGAKFAEGFRALDDAKRKLESVDKAADKLSTRAGAAVGTGLRAAGTAAIAAANRMSPRSKPRTWAMLSCASRLRSSDHALAASGIGSPRQSAKPTASSTLSTATEPSTLHSRALR